MFLYHHLNRDQEGRLVKIKVNVRPPYPLKIFCLTMEQPRHIYLPLISNELLLLDRNVLSRASSTRKSPSAAVSYWIDEFNRVSRNINPIMTAYEGSAAREPTRMEFQIELADACRRLQLLYPHKNVIEHSAKTSGELFDALAAKLERRRHEAAFLIDAAPLVAQRPSSKDLMPKIRDIITEANAKGLLNHSLVHIALLSCLAESRHGDKKSAGRSVLKPRAAFNERDAHNAVSDIHLLEFLIASSAYHLGPVALCTMDEGLAKLWIKLKVSRADRTIENDIRFRFSIDEGLFPRLNPDQLQELRSALN